MWESQPKPYTAEFCELNPCVVRPTFLILLNFCFLFIVCTYRWHRLSSMLPFYVIHHFFVWWWRWLYHLLRSFLKKKKYTWWLNMKSEFLQDNLEMYLQDKGIPVDIVCCLQHLQVTLIVCALLCYLFLSLNCVLRDSTYPAMFRDWR